MSPVSSGTRAGRVPGPGGVSPLVAGTISISTCPARADRVNAAHAGGVPTATRLLEEVIVTGKLQQLSGAPVSATVGVATDEQLSLRPVMRTGELLEAVPGLVVTQHSGDGKANQYFLRGFNLDHGTDLATSVDGVPVNMPTHAHGQGYTDINFVIPELVQAIEYALSRPKPH